MIDAHRGAFEYDWRHRFKKPLSIIGTKRMSWGEALRLTEKLAIDPSSCIGAELSEWDSPVSREALVGMDVYDLTHQIAWAKGGRRGPRPRPYPRPWPDRTKKHLAPGAEVTQEQVLDALRAAGHDGPVPTQ